MSQPKIKQKPAHIIKNNLAVIAKVARLTPGYIIAMALEGIVYGALNACETLFMFRLFNALDENPSFERIALIILTLAVFYLIARLYTNWYWHYYHAAVQRKLIYKMHRELFEKARQMDLACYDDPVFYNDFVWAMDQSHSRAVSVIEDVGKIINRLVASGTIFSVLFTVDVAMSLVLLACCVFTIVLRQYMNKVSFRHREETQAMHRHKNYINRLYYLSDYAKELRISEVDKNLMDAYWKNMDGIVETDLRYGKTYFLWNDVVAGIVDNLTYYGILVYMVVQLSLGNVLIGGLAASVNAVWSCRWMLSDLVNRFTKFPEHSLYIQKYLAFLANKPTIVSGEGEVGELEELVLEDVGFTYPVSQKKDEGKEEAKDEAPDESKDAPKPSLTNVSLTIKRGEKIAFVGYNGAGKTTLTKLLMRLYDPSEGRILYNGQDLRELSLEQLRSHIGAVFQDYRLFGATVAENVLGDVYDGTPEQEATVKAALHAATFDEKLEQLPDGINTLLTREFDDKGVNLSGGEAQKVAIARCFAHPFELMILDEPSSALDPLAEYELNHAILKKADEKTVIFISHRLSTTRMADRIYMFENGAIIESGSHEELMEQNGKYAEMFRLQAEKYRTKE
jgi:ATP-binding cassette subfamily B protein